MRLIRSHCRRKISVKDETHDNIVDEADEDNLYKIYKMTFDEKEYRKRVFKI